MILVFSYVSLTEIKTKDEDFEQKWGSLFNEFKNDRGFLSSQYYFIYFSRRVAYVLSQVYLNSYLFLQGGLNIFFSFLTLIFLLFYVPFKDSAVFYSNLVGEISITVVMIATFCFLWDLEEFIQGKLESLIIFSVIAGIMIQFLISIFIFGKSLKLIWKKIEKTRALNFVKRAGDRSTNAGILMKIDRVSF